MHTPHPTTRSGQARRLIVIVVAVLVIAATVFLVVRGRSPSSDSLTSITVAQWGQERYLIYLPLYVAMERGYFEKRGIKVSLTFSGNDDQTFAAVVSGGALFGIGDPAFAAIAQERGLPAKVIATVVGGVAIWGVTSRDDIPILASPADLAGLRIGTFPAPSTNYTLMKELIETLPASATRPTIVQAPIGSQLALLETGAADIAMVLEPAASVAESQGYRIVYSSPAFHGPYAFTGVTTTQENLNKHPDIAARFVAALEEAVRACHRDPSISEDVAQALFPNLSKAVITSAVTRMLREGTFPATVVVSEESWQRALQTRLQAGDLRNPQPTEATVDNSFAHEASKGAGG